MPEERRNTTKKKKTVLGIQLKFWDKSISQGHLGKKGFFNSTIKTLSLYSLLQTRGRKYLLHSHFAGGSQAGGVGWSV